MARPRSEKPSLLPTLRGTALSIRLSFGELKYSTPVLAKVEPEFIGKNGYVKPSHPNYLNINEALAAATERLEQAFAIAQHSGDLTVQRIKQVYLQLTSEAEASAQREQLRQQAEQQKEDFKRRLRDERRLLARVRDEDLDEHIAELETKLVELRLRRDNLRRAAGSYEDDLLTTYLTRYATRKGIATMAATTRSSHMALVTTISHFAPATRIQDVDEAWLIKFQDWLVTTPSKRAIYRRTKNPDYGELDDRKLVAKEFLYYKETSTRKNSSVERYIERVKGCLRYYQARPHLLPPGVVVSDSFKLYEFDLAAKEDNVVALEEAELFQLFAFDGVITKPERRALDIFLFLCATGLRFNDLQKVKKTSIVDGMIHLVARKTRKHKIVVDIPLNVISTHVLEKYNYDMTTCKLTYTDTLLGIRSVLNHNEGKTFPTLQEPHTSVNYSGAQELVVETTRANAIGTHSGRRTFINICLDYNVPLNKLVGMTGHRNVNTLMVYANKRKDVKKHMRNIFQLPAYEPHDYVADDLAEEIDGLD